MPNHVKNVLKFKHLSATDKGFILTNFTRETPSDDGIYPLNRVFDLDKIIPEPRLESECPEDCKVNKDSHVTEDKDRPWFDWYTWHNKYWGTKWNTYDCYTQIGKTYVTFVFSTAWSAPLLVYELMAKKYPAFEWEVKYADEDWGSNCGIIIYDPKRTGFATPCHHTERDVRNAFDFAKRLWATY